MKYMIAALLMIASLGAQAHNAHKGDGIMKMTYLLYSTEVCESQIAYDGKKFAKEFMEEHNGDFQEAMAAHPEIVQKWRGLIKIGASCELSYNYLKGYRFLK